MKYANALLFTGKCLTLGTYPEKAEEIKQEIRQGKIRWETIVQVSSGQLVLPALYIRLKKASLLGELPPDLVEHLEYLTALNRNRNLAIIKQVHDIATLLNRHNIFPVFLKGVAHLLTGIYEDPAERMIGDIDFLVEEKEMHQTAQLLVDEGYVPKVKFHPVIHNNIKHYPRLMNENYPAAVEIHRQVIVPPYDKKFNASQFLRHKQKIDGDWKIYVPCARHLILHNTLNAQINDKAYQYCSVLMRQMYDLFLLSTQEDPKLVVREFGKYRKLSNAYLTVTSKILSLPTGFNLESNLQLRFFMKRFNYFLANPGLPYSLYRALVYFSFRISRYISMPLKAIFRKDERIGLWFRLSDSKWYGQHFASYRSFFRPGVN